MRARCSASRTGRPCRPARRSGCGERYVREWLNAQAAGGYVDYHAASGTYELSPEQAMALADDTSPVYMPNAWQVVASMWADEPKSLEAIKSGRVKSVVVDGE